MTAIFAVWNNIGFSLASDSNQSVNQDNQTWIDPVEKIIMLEKHQIAMAVAGASLLEGVEVNEIFRTWEKTLPDDGFETFNDYFVNFTSWYANQDFPNATNSIAKFGQEVEHWLTEIHKQLAAVSSKLEIPADYFSSHATTSRDSLNFFGDNWDVFADEDEVNNGVLAEEYMSMQNLYEKFSLEYRSADNYINHEITQHPDFESELAPIIVEKFQEIFETPFEEDNETHQNIAAFCMMQIENRFILEGPVKIMLIGYGNDDWLPTGINFELSSNLSGIPRLRILHVSNPNQNWYLSLAAESNVQQLTSGHSYERGREIIDFADSHLKKGHRDTFEVELNRLRNDKFHDSLARIDNLTLPRLEFVSRLFVQIEALKSFLDEPVPGVGGDTQVISMTKTTRKQRRYEELD